MDRTKLAIENRKKFPKCYEVIELFREHFGEVKVLHVKENGKERGKEWLNK